MRSAEQGEIMRAQTRELAVAQHAELISGECAELAVIKRIEHARAPIHHNLVGGGVPRLDRGSTRSVDRSSDSWKVALLMAAISAVSRLAS